MISKKTKYALIALSQLAESHGSKKPVLISEVAERGRIPKKFLEAILLELKNDGLLLSRKGPGGGYRLAKAPEQIVLGQVLRLLEGPLAPLPCASRTAYRKCEECVDEHTCPIRMVMTEVRDAMAGVLDDTTLADMAEKGKLQATGMYFI